MDKLTKKYFFIYESPHIVPNHNIEILEEQQLPNSNIKKLIFKAQLQTANETNGNKRLYTPDILTEIVNQLTVPATNRGLYMELDHPFVQTTDPQVAKKRAAIVEIKTSAALLTNLSLINNNVIGKVETLSNRHGQDLYNIIKYDKATIGFSLRALGSLEQLPDGTMKVTKPIKAITYDIVSNPSHKSAKILEFLPEHVEDFKFDSTLLTEGLNDLPEKETITICDGNICVERFLDDVIQEKLNQYLTKEFNLGI